MAEAERPGRKGPADEVTDSWRHPGKGGYNNLSEMGCHWRFSR